MLESISHAWHVTIPTLVTGVFLLKILQHIRQQEAARAPVPAYIAEKR
jgi:hypothetical protein